MKKRLFAILVSVSLLSTMVLSGCGQNSTDEKVTSGVIRIAYNNIENYPHYKGLERAAQEIEDRSDGRFTVKIYSNGTLGDQRAALELTQNNAVQMCVANATMVESWRIVRQKMKLSKNAKMQMRFWLFIDRLLQE